MKSKSAQALYYLEYKAETYILGNSITQLRIFAEFWCFTLHEIQIWRMSLFSWHINSQAVLFK